MSDVRHSARPAVLDNAIRSPAMLIKRRHSPWWNVALIAIGAASITGCTQRNVEGVVRDFLSAASDGKYQTAKATTLARPLLSAIESPFQLHHSVEADFNDLASRDVSGFTVRDTAVRGESAHVVAIVTMKWGTQRVVRFDLVKEDGAKWKIGEWVRAGTVGGEQLAKANESCGRSDSVAAYANYNEAFSQNPKDAAILTEWASCALRLSDLQTAASKAEQAIQMYPDELWTTYLILGRVYEQQDKPDAALSAYEHAVRNRPDDPDSLNTLAWCYANRKIRLSDAIQLAEKAVSLRPRVAEYVDTLGWAHYRNGAMAEAAAAIARAYQMKPSSPLIKLHYEEVVVDPAEHIRRSYALTSLGRFQEAIAEAEVAVRRNPNDPSALQARGDANSAAVEHELHAAESALNSGMYDQASRHAGNALAFDPQNARAKEMQSRIAQSREILGR